MRQVTDRIGLKDHQTKARRIDLNIFTLGPVRGDKFQYILIKNNGKYNLDCYSAFFYNFSISYPWRISYIIQLLLDDLDPTLVDHLSHYLSARPLKHPFQLSVSLVAKAVLFKGLFHINAARKLTAEHSMRWQQLYFRYFLVPIIPICS